MIHYHGTPLSPREQLYTMAGKHFCVPFSDPRDAAVCVSIGQSVMFDNGAFSFHTRGEVPDWQAYYAWLDPLLHHPHWAVIPDVIGADWLVQQRLILQWPYHKSLSAPVWHLNESIDWLMRLADAWPRICFGSAAQYWSVGTDRWAHRMDQAFNELAKRHRRMPWIHMLRGLSQAGKRWPFASADSTNVALSHGREQPVTGPMTRRAPRDMADEIDRVQCPSTWTERPIQMPLDEEILG